jgi:hypothetical protein
MPSIPDIPGRGLATRTTKRALAAVGGGVATVAGGLVRQIEKSGSAPEPRAPRPEPRAPQPAKPEPQKPRPAKPKTAKPRSRPKPKAARDPHHALNNPAVDPDETEYPDPFEKREDPRDPAGPDDIPFGEEAHPPTGAESTSEPPPGQDPEVGDRAEPPRRQTPRRQNLDD